MVRPSESQKTLKLPGVHFPTFAAMNHRDVLWKRLEPWELRRGKDGACLTTVIWAGLEDTDASLSCQISGEHLPNQKIPRVLTVTVVRVEEGAVYCSIICRKSPKPGVHEPAR